MRKSGQAVIVEGYTDALMAHQAGFDNVVACLGTALTPGQVALLTRYASRIALAYDVDPAGEKAGTFGVTALAGLIGQLQGDETGRQARGRPRRPAARRQGPRRGRPRGAGRLGGGRRQGQAARRVPHRHHAGRYDLKTAPADRLRRGGHAGHPRRRRSAPARRGPPAGPARVSGVEERVLRQVLERPARNPVAAPGGGRRPRRRAADHRRRGPRPRPDALPVGDILRGVTPVEAELLRLLLLVPEQQLRVVDELGPDQLPSTVARELFRAIVLQREPDDQGVHPPFDRRGAAPAARPRDRLRSPRR